MNILITGTSRGIGLSLTQQALEEGHTVFAVARNANSSTQLQSLQKQFTSKLKIISVELTAVEGIDKIAKEIGDHPIDILINNAGVFRKDESIKDFQETYLINTIVPFFMTKTFLPNLKKAKHPKAIHITSRMGSISDNTSGGYYSYRSSKTALNMINKSLTIDQPWLTTMVIHPGWVQTDMGGAGAQVSPKDSAAGIWKVIQQATLEQSGHFVDYQGKLLPW